ncbi:MAG: hypothetical protein PQJ49_01470 [Sphaerochaetaceae bacterium]|nr:hypothetical protein [Sphaerochaetaceae bacterium]
MKTLIAFLAWYFSKKKWILVEAHTAVWNLNHGNRGLVQEFVFYRIEYCPKINEYRITWEGKDGDKHSMYGEMLKRLAALNSNGDYIDDYLNNVESGVDNIIITKFPLSNEAEDVFRFVKEDPDLIEAIENVKKGLKKNSIEIFEHRGNIIATDVGYFGAFYESDLLKEDPNKDNDNEEKPE